jgi:hypothetical protein
MFPVHLRGPYSFFLEFIKLTLEEDCRTQVILNIEFDVFRLVQLFRKSTEFLHRKKNLSITLAELINKLEHAVFGYRRFHNFLVA